MTCKISYLWEVETNQKFHIYKRPPPKQQPSQGNVKLVLFFKFQLLKCDTVKLIKLCISYSIVLCSARSKLLQPLLLRSSKEIKRPFSAFYFLALSCRAPCWPVRAWLILWLCSHWVNPELWGETFQKNKVHMCCKSMNEWVFPL